MEKDKFIELLQNPGLVSKAQSNDLESMIEDYPYFQSARALNLKGLKQKESFKYNQALKHTAAYTTDRSILFDFITSEIFNQNQISLAIKHNSEQLKSMSVVEYEDISINKSVSIDEALKKHIKNTEGVLDPDLFVSKVAKSTSADLLEDELLRVDAKNIEEAPQVSLGLGKPLNFDKNETHSFAEWLKITNFKPIERNKGAVDLETLPSGNNQEKLSNVNNKIEKKFQLIDKFLENNPKIIPSKERPKTEAKPLPNISNDELMTETLARIYLEQKNYEKAIQSYKILSLKYPEKSGFFADQIKAVEKLLENNKKE